MCHIRAGGAAVVRSGVDEEWGGEGVDAELVCARLEEGALRVGVRWKPPATERPITGMNTNIPLFGARANVIVSVTGWG